MFVKEQHIGVRARLQNMNTHAFRGYRDERIDILLNRAQTSVFVDRYDINGNNSFERFQKYRDELSSLVVHNYPLPSYVALGASNSLRRSFNFDGATPLEYESYLPGDYAYGVGYESKVFYNLCSDIDYEISSTDISIGIIRYVTNPDTIGSTSITSVSYSFNGSAITGTITVPTGYPDWSDYQFPDDGYQFAQDLISHANSYFSGNGIDYELHWESYSGLYRPNSIIIVSNDNLSGDCTLTLDGAGYDMTTTMQSKSLKTVTPDTDTGSYVYADAEMRRYNEIKTLLKNEFHKPTHEKVLLVEKEKSLVQYSDDYFVVTELYLDYLRFPKPISLRLNQSCELHPDLHEKICDKAAEFAVAIHNHPNWQKVLVEQEKNNV